MANVTLAPKPPDMQNVSRERWQNLRFLPKRNVIIEPEPERAFHVCGMVSLGDGRIMVADTKSLKVYSPDLKMSPDMSPDMTTSPDLTMSAETLGLNTNDKITDIALFEDTVTAVAVGSGCSKIYFINISSVPLSVSRCLNTEYQAHGITACRQYLYVTTTDDPPSVKKIDKNGQIYWSVSHDDKGKLLFKQPYGIASLIVEDSIRLVVTENSRYKTVSLLNGDSGKILTARTGLHGMRGVATDSFNNIFICYVHLGMVSVITPDLSEERIVLISDEKKQKFDSALAHDLDLYPQNIAFDCHSNSIFITCGSCGTTRDRIQVYPFI